MNEFKMYPTKEKIIVVTEYLLAVLIPLLLVAAPIIYQNYNQNFTNMIDVKYETKLTEIGNFTKGESLEEPFYIVNSNINVPVFIRYYFEMNGDFVDDLINVDNPNIIEENGYYYVKASNKARILLFDELNWQKDLPIKNKTNMYIKVDVIEAKENAINKLWIKNNQLSKNNAQLLGYFN